jgi:RNA polymerase sigma-70 factor (ECF subfamily)
MAQIALRDPDDALDVVQDAMLKLARNYAARPSAEWRPLFYRIMENGIRDLQRRRSVRKRFMTWLPGPKEDPDHEAQDPLDNVADSAPVARALSLSMGPKPERVRSRRPNPEYSRSTTWPTLVQTTARR